MTTQPPPSDSAPDRGFLGKLFGLYFSPAESFGAILGRPGFWLPLLALVAVNVAFTAVWVDRTDARVLVREQWEEYGVWERIPAERRDAQLDEATQTFGRQAYLGALLGPVVVLFVVAGASLLVFAFILGADVRFRQVMTVVTWAFLAVGIVQTLLISATLHLKDDWNVMPHQALQANPGLFLDRQETSPVLFAVADSLDLISLWTVWLLSVGLGVASRRPTGSAAVGVVVLWGVWILLKVGFSALMPSLFGG